ncbi:hypothetical protein EXIGLDRAFT_722136 [Exidia glandulosa HHB12029]|uniref:Uncharacterized protein n=1 Tax=Exidia glandulosa HHB12029 TaxID=1314781 RepID=A0A165FES6_EXIGL|nr:hypothetical protein EXIGLDRAFT_722136 [Exidia glandulosa HHB12029]
MCWNQIIYACKHSHPSFSLTCKCATRGNDVATSIRCRPACPGPTPAERAAAANISAVS